MSTKKRVKGYNYDKPSFYIEDDDSKSQVSLSILQLFNCSIKKYLKNII